MRRRPRHLMLPVMVVMIALGCASRAPYTITKDFESKAIKVIAVAPVENGTAEIKAPQLLRNKIIAQLYFKGYSRLLPAILDKRLENINNTQEYRKENLLSQRNLDDLLGADAVMFCSLTEATRTKGIFYAYVTVAISCELQATKTREVLWNSQYKAISRNFDITRKRLEMKSYEVFENLMEEAVSKVIETIPLGPNLRS